MGKTGLALEMTQAVLYETNAFWGWGGAVLKSRHRGSWSPLGAQGRFPRLQHLCQALKVEPAEGEWAESPRQEQESLEHSLCTKLLTWLHLQATCPECCYAHDKILGSGKRPEWVSPGGVGPRGRKHSWGAPPVNER